jgi:hypothetical protein
MRPGIALLAVILLIPSPDKEQERERIDSLIRQEDWKAAKKALKAYLKKHADSPEEKEEIRTLLDRATGLITLEKIQKEYQRTARIRRAVGKVTKLLEKHGHDAVLRERAEGLLADIRSRYVHVLDDFEVWQDKDGEACTKRGDVVIETDPEWVKEGRRSGRWTSKSGGSCFWVKPQETDWTDYDLFCLWIHNGRREGPRMGHIRVQVVCKDGGSFTTLIALEWEGWRNLQIPLRGRGGRFLTDGRGDWSDILTVYMYQVDILPTPIGIVVDDIRLEKAVK